MVKNNHFHDNPLRHLEEQFFGQTFDDGSATDTRSQRIAALYCRTESATAVLSDLRSDRSTIFHGVFSETMGLGDCGTQQIDSIWEESIYARIHPDDLAARHLLELRLFRLLKHVPAAERTRYRTQSLLRMADAAGRYRPVLHRTFYLDCDTAGALRTALCLYGFAPTGELPQQFEGIIQNMATGEVIRSGPQQTADLLTRREKEILLAIEAGFSSKEIALRSNISKHTVDRHRQNIREKLRVRSTIEALKVARELKLL